MKRDTSGYQAVLDTLQAAVLQVQHVAIVARRQTIDAQAAVASLERVVAEIMIAQQAHQEGERG